MKPILKIFFFLLFSVFTFAQNYTVLLTPYFKENLRDVYFINEQVGWTSGSKGAIHKTTDGGSSWTEQVSGVSTDLAKIHFLDQNLGWIATVSGSVIKTSDGGNSWTEYIFANLRPSISFNLCDGLIFTDPDNGFVIAGQVKSFYLFKTTDGGINWSVKDSLITNDNTYRWWDIDFNGSNGVMVSSKKNWQKYTTNLGENWALSTPIVDNFYRDLKAVRWINPTTLVAIGEGNEFNGVPIPIFKSTDGGITWVKKNSSISTYMERAKDLYFKDGSEGIAVGSNGFTKACIIKTADAGETWTTSVANYSFGLQAISGVNNTIYALGSGSHIIKSTDFGTNWSLFPITTPTSIYSIYGGNDKAFALNRSGDFYVSNDGSGKEWQYLSNAGQNDCVSMYFFNSSTGLILKENKHIVKTTDGGQSWRTVLAAVPYNSRNKVAGLTFADANTGYAFFTLNDYGEYYIYKTTDAGETWNQSYTGGGPGYISGDIVFFDANTGVALGPNNWMLRTTDGGTTWAQANAVGFPASFEGKDFEDVALISDTKAIAIGEQFICMTTDKGLNWNYIDHHLTGIDSTFYTIAFKDQNNGVIGQYDGIIFQTTDGGSTWSKDTTLQDQHFLFSSGYNKDGKLLLGTAAGYIVGDASIVSAINDEFSANISGYELKQNYPNPFNPVTSITFQVPEKSIVELNIYDLLGRKVSTLVNGIVSAGSHTVQFDASKLTSGVYFYRLNAGAFSQSRKLVLIK